jgi:lysophospholipase L1-like esterase
VACVGDSITFGAGIKNRNQNSYPAQLQKLLGDDYAVKNFGFSARTLLKKGDHPYWIEKMYQNALNLKPNYVIIKLGTNDVKPKNWKYKENFKTELEEFAKSFTDLSSRPKVFLSYPVPVQQDKWGINEKSITNGVIPMVKAASDDLNIPVIDFYHAVPAEAKYYVDGVHPNATGAHLMAVTVWESIKDRPYTSEQ